MDNCFFKLILLPEHSRINVNANETVPMPKQRCDGNDAHAKKTWVV